jgi:hypothetical protein
MSPPGWCERLLESCAELPAPPKKSGAPWRSWMKV